MTKTLSFQDALRWLVLEDPSLSPEQLRGQLKRLGFECSLFLVSSLRKRFKNDLKFLKRIGLLRNKQPIFPAEILDLPDPEPVITPECGKKPQKLRQEAATNPEPSRELVPRHEPKPRPVKRARSSSREKDFRYPLGRQSRDD